MSDNDDKQTFRPLDELSYEQARDELVEVVKILELGQMSLDESLRFWERGEELAAYCERYLDGAAERVETALQNRGDANGGSSDGADGDDGAAGGPN